MKEDYVEILKKALEVRMKEGGLPPKLEIKENEEAIVRIIDIVQNPWKPDSKIFIVQNLEDGLQYRLPVNIGIYRVLSESGAKIGDYLLLRYQGSVLTKSGRTVKRWSIGYLSAEEAKNIIQSYQKKEGQEEKEEAKEAPSESLDDQKKNEIKQLISSLIKIYGFTTISDLDYYFNKIKNYNIQITKDFIESLGFKLQGDKIVK